MVYPAAVMICPRRRSAAWEMVEGCSREGTSNSVSASMSRYFAMSGARQINMLPAMKLGVCGAGDGECICIHCRL